MRYCTTADVDYIVAQGATSATNPNTQQKRNLLLIGKVRDKNVIPDDTVEQFIRSACQEVDGHLSELYRTPFREKVQFETTLSSDISEYSPYLVLQEDGSLDPGDIVIVQQGSTKERLQINEVIADGIYSTVETISFPFTAGARLIQVGLPAPIQFISVRLAAANLYDKFFSAQVSPNISEYGKNLREQARSKINDILNGRTVLHSVQRIGRRLYDPNIEDQYGLPQGSDPERNVDRLGG
jgi:hypothetical protein